MTSHSSLKGIVLPTHPLPPEQALGEDLVPMLLNFFLRHWQNKQVFVPGKHFQPWACIFKSFTVVI